MSTPTLDAIAALHAAVDDHVELARSSSREHLRELARAHRRLSDLQLVAGDPFAAHLHIGLAVMYSAHALADAAAKVIALGGENPLDDQ